MKTRSAKNRQGQVIVVNERGIYHNKNGKLWKTYNINTRNYQRIARSFYTQSDRDKFNCFISPMSGALGFMIVFRTSSRVTI